MSIPRLSLPALIAALAMVLTATACTSEDATPIGEATTTLPPTPHLLAPTEQMEDLARQQCLDDPDLEQGEVNAVDPARPDQNLATVVVDCADVRAGGTGTTDPAATDPSTTDPSITDGT